MQLEFRHVLIAYWHIEKGVMENMRHEHLFYLTLYYDYV